MRTTVTCLVLAAAVLWLPGPPPAHAATQTVLGRRMQIVNPGVPVRRRITAVGQERVSDNTIVGNPVLSGASLRVVANGGTDSDQTFSLPTAGWRSMMGGMAFSFSNRNTGGAVKKVSIRRKPTGGFQIRVLISGRDGTVNVVPPDPGESAGFALTLGGGDTYCASFGNGAGGIVQANDARRYQARNPTAEACPPAGGTTSSTTTTIVLGTSTSTLSPCPPPPPAALGSLTTTIGMGTTDCGGPGLVPGPQPEFSGEVLNPDNSFRENLGLGCLYVGSAGGSLPGSRLPDGGVSMLDVASINGTVLEVTASDGTGPATCTKGAGPATVCLNGLGPCSSDAHCANTSGACDVEAHCYFGPPVPVPQGGASICILNAIVSDVCAEADLASMDTTITAASLSARVYITGNNALPCPRCVGGTCDAGQRAGMACGGGVGSQLTTIECPPTLAGYAGKLDVDLGGLTTATSTLTADPQGNFCPGQPIEGAFGAPAGEISETGVPLGGGMTAFDTVLAGTFCVPSSGTGLFDVVAGLPGPGAVGVPATVSICLVPSVCNDLCNPCTLGPLCAIVCDPVCNLCS